MPSRWTRPKPRGNWGGTPPSALLKEFSLSGNKTNISVLNGNRVLNNFGSSANVLNFFTNLNNSLNVWTKVGNGNTGGVTVPVVTP